MKWGAWALMPNHVHIALRPLGDQDLAAAVRSIKGSSAHAANRLLHRSGSRFWASDYFGRRIRDRDHEGRVTRYIAAFSENLHFQAARPLATGTDRDVRMIR
jgi:REP element-mobilizing transposase RayT